MRAADAARKQGGNPTAIDALAGATAGPVTIAGFTLKPATEGTIWTLKRVAREFRAWADGLGMPHATGPENGTREMLELGLSTLVFADARACWIQIEEGNFPALISQADTIMWEMDLATTRALEAHFQKQMESIRALTPDAEDRPGKPPETGENGTSPEMPTQPEAADSPPSSGSPPSMPSPSPQPSGTLRS